MKSDVTFNWCVLIAIMAMCQSVFAPVAVADGPTTKEPAELFEVRQHDSSTSLRTKANVLYPEIVAELAEYEQNLADGKYKNVSSRELRKMGATSVKINQLGRIAERLELLKETAGADLKLRQQILSGRLVVVTSTYRELDGAAQVLQAERAQATRESKAHERQVTRIGTLFKQGRVELAESALHEIYDDLEVLVAGFKGAAREKYFAPFQPAMRQVYTQLIETRTQETVALLEELEQDKNYNPPYEAVLARINASIKSVADDGKAAWSGQELDGPQLIPMFVGYWERINVIAWRNRALLWAQDERSGTTPPSRLDELESRHAQFQVEMTKAFTDLIAADAKRMTAETGPAMYDRYVAALAKISPRISHPGFVESVEAALPQLVADSPGRDEEIDAYREATKDLLKWRRRMAEAYARAKAKDAVEIPVLLAEASRPAAKIKREHAGRLDVKLLVSSAPHLLHDVGEIMHERSVIANGIVPGEQQHASLYQERHYCQMSAIEAPQALLDAFRDDLLVTAESPPLTLQAAAAVESAAAGAAYRAGGHVKQAKAMSLLSHFAAVSDGAAGHLPVGSFPKEDLGRDGQRVLQLLWCIEVEPEWVQNPYLFIDLK